jgi:hypothetical protein
VNEADFKALVSGEKEGLYSVTVKVLADIIREIGD